MLRVIVAGTRTFNNYALLERKLDAIFLRFESEDVAIISGCCVGADALGERYAREYGLMLIQCPARWDTYGKRAGHVRNTLMADIATHLVVFWDGKSAGTKMMIDIARAKGLPLRVIRY